MSTQINTASALTPAILERIVAGGDLRDLSPSQRVEYYAFRCTQAGLDPAAKPFDYLQLNGKTVLYANATATQQLTSSRGLSYQVTHRERLDDIYTVFVRVYGSDSRSTENMGAVPIGGLKGEALANAMMKAQTKAIRRAVLAHCGLGMLDETETETIPGAKRVEHVEEGWSDADLAAAKADLGIFADHLLEAGASEAEIAETIARPKSTIGDPSLSYEKWNNRLAAYSQRHLAKFRPAPMTEAEERQVLGQMVEAKAEASKNAPVSPAAAEFVDGLTPKPTKRGKSAA